MAQKALAALARFLAAEKAMKLRHLSNDAAEDAALNFNRDLAEVSVAAYALHKILTKEHIIKNPKWAEAKRRISQSLSKALGALQAGNGQEFRKHLKSVSEYVRELDRELGNYFQKTFEKARIKQASRAYAAGLSMGQAAELMGTEARHLQSYVGVTTIHEEIKAKKSVKERLKSLREVLG